MVSTISHTWLGVKPLKACYSRYFVDMGKSAVAVMAENLRALKKALPELRPQVKLAKKAGVGEGTVSRARRGDGNTTVKNLEAIARAYRVEAWQLLKPELEPPKPDGAQNESEPNAAQEPGVIDVDTELEEIEMVQLLPEQVELAKMWMKLDERDRMKFKRELYSKALQHADEVPDERLGHLSAAEKQREEAAAAARASQVKRKPGKETN